MRSQLTRKHELLKMKYVCRLDLRCNSILEIYIFGCTVLHNMKPMGQEFFIYFFASEDVPVVDSILCDHKRGRTAGDLGVLRLCTFFLLMPPPPPPPSGTFLELFGFPALQVVVPRSYFLTTGILQCIISLSFVTAKP